MDNINYFEHCYEQEYCLKRRLVGYGRKSKY